MTLCVTVRSSVCVERNKTFSPNCWAQVPLLLCVVVVGNSYPVSESPQDADGGFNGKPIRAKADSHITVVAKASADALPLPLPPSRWGSARVFTELVVRDESQVLRCSPRLSWRRVPSLGSEGFEPPVFF